MLGFLGNLRRHRAVAKRLRLARLDAFPRTYINTVRFQLSRGDVQGALETSQEGLGRFPCSEELTSLHRFSARQLAAPTRKTLLEAFAADGDAASAIRLARLHLECGEFEDALTLMESLDDGSACAQILRLKGEIHVRRFFLDRDAMDARLGIDFLEHSIDDESLEFDVLWLLAQIHEIVGVVSRSLALVDRVLTLDPDHTGACALQARLMERPIESSSTSELLHSLEQESGGSRNEQAEIPVNKTTTNQLARLSQFRGVQNVFFLSGQATVVASNGECSNDISGEHAALCELARSFRKNGGHGVRRMGIGALHNLVIEAADRSLLLFATPGGALLVESNAACRRALLRSECDDLIASWSQPSMELTRA